MAMPSKHLISNTVLTDILNKYRLGVPLAALHRIYIAQGSSYMLSLPVFMKLVKEWDIFNRRLASIEPIFTVDSSDSNLVTAIHYRGDLVDFPQGLTLRDIPKETNESNTRRL